MTRAYALVLALALAPVADGAAQEWRLGSGFSAGVQWTDNYGFASANPRSGTTVTLAPFVSAVRSTESSTQSASAAVGLNEVFTAGSNQSYLSGRVAANGSWTAERARLAVFANALRESTFVNAGTAEGVTLARTYRTAPGFGGTVSYRLTERLAAVAGASWGGNYFANAGGTPAATLSDSTGYALTSSLQYALSPRTGLFGGVSWSRFASDITRSSVLSVNGGATHQFSERLSLSASAGYFWTTIDSTRTFLACPAPPVLCAQGLVPLVPVQIGSERRDTGTLYNGSLQYAFDERTRLGASLSESIQPSAVGALQRFNVAAVTLSHELSERLTGRASVGYSETTLPTGLSGSFTNTFLSAGAGMAYRLADAWTLEARYSYGRAEYAQAAVAPTANTVLVTLAYNWPGASFSNVFGAGPDAFLGGPGLPSSTSGVPGAPPLPGSATRPQPAGRDAPPPSPGQSSDHKSVSGAP